MWAFTMARRQKMCCGGRPVWMLLVLSVTVATVDGVSNCPPGGSYYDKNTGRSECCFEICEHAELMRTEDACNKFCPGKLALKFVLLFYRFIAFILRTWPCVFIINMLMISSRGSELLLYVVCRPACVLLVIVQLSMRDTRVFGFFNNSWSFGELHARWRHAHVDSTTINLDLRTHTRAPRTHTLTSARACQKLTEEPWGWRKRSWRFNAEAMFPVSLQFPSF